MKKIISLLALTAIVPAVAVSTVAGAEALTKRVIQKETTISIVDDNEIYQIDGDKNPNTKDIKIDNKDTKDIKNTKDIQILPGVTLQQENTARFEQMKQKLNERFKYMFDLKKNLDYQQAVNSANWNEYYALQQAYEKEMKKLVADWVTDMQYNA